MVYLNGYGKRQIVIFSSDTFCFDCHYYIDKDGFVIQKHSLHYDVTLNIPENIFIHHGITPRNLSSGIVAISLKNYGALVKKNDDFYQKRFVIEALKIKPAYPYEYCTKAKWRNEQYWDGYTTKQLESMEELLQSLCRNLNITKTYNPDIWDVSRRALMGTAGIFCHCSFRNDVSDPHPQIELVNMLKAL